MTSESSEKFIRMPVLNEMLEIHDRPYHTTMQFMMDSVKDDIKSLKQSVDEMKQSLHYTQKDIDVVKARIEEIGEKTKNWTSQLQILRWTLKICTTNMNIVKINQDTIM